MNTSVEYARRLYDDVLGWYRSADGKAQVVLAIDGAFLAFLTGSIFVAPKELTALAGRFTSWTWTLLAVMIVSLAASIASALYCLWSRIYSRAGVTRIVAEAQKVNTNPDLYAPEITWFFQFVATLDTDKFHRTLASVDAGMELRVLSSQIRILAVNVRKKHLAADIGFVLAALTLGLSSRQALPTWHLPFRAVARRRRVRCGTGIARSSLRERCPQTKWCSK